MGKRLPKRATEIAIQFKEVPHQLFQDSATDPEANLLAMRIQPDEGIMLRFGAKVPGLGVDVRNVTMDFTYGSAFQADSPDAYETLILDALLGDASLFTRARRGGGGVVDRRPDHRGLGRDAAAGVPELRGRHVGPRGGRRPARPRGPALAPDLSAQWTARSRIPAAGVPRTAAATSPVAAASARSSRSGRGRPAAGGSSWRTRRSPASRRCAGCRTRTRSTTSRRSWPGSGRSRT